MSRGPGNASSGREVEGLEGVRSEWVLERAVGWGMKGLPGSAAAFGRPC